MHAYIFKHHAIYWIGCVVCTLMETMKWPTRFRVLNCDGLGIWEKGTILHAKYTFCLFQNHWPWEPQTSDLIYSCKCSSSWFLKCMYMYNHFLMKILGVVGKVPFCQILLIKFVILSFMLGFATIVQLLVRTVMKIAPLKRRRRQGLVCSERERSQLTLPRQLQQRRLEMKTLPQHLSRMEKVSKSFKWVVLGIH